MYEIVRVFNEPHDVQWASTGNGIRLHTCGESKIVMRVGMRPGQGEFARWLVGEVIAGQDKDGRPLPVYLYAERGADGIMQLVMTKEVMSP